MSGNLFLGFVAVGIGLGAAAYGYGGVFLVICGICLGSAAWGAAVSISNRPRAAVEFIRQDDGRGPRPL